MIRATTPTHKFIFPENVSVGNITKLLITYKQSGNVIIERTKDDVVVSPIDNSVSVSFTQEEMNLFNPGSCVAQIRAKNSVNSVLASQIIKMHVGQVLNEEIL